jgi:photosystem I P700 chlorophyll a apoprotein A1
MYNSLSIAIFHFSWKMQSDVWGTVNASGISHITGGNFAQSANTINGWLRDFMGTIVTSYSIIRFCFLSAYGLIFLRRSLYLGIQSYVLIQWSWLLARINRINSFGHNKLKVVQLFNLVPLSITVVGCWCCSLPTGGIATTWAFFEARIISVG